MLLKARLPGYTNRDADPQNAKMHSFKRCRSLSTTAPSSEAKNKESRSRQRDGRDAQLMSKEKAHETLRSACAGEAYPEAAMMVAAMRSLERSDGAPRDEALSQAVDGSWQLVFVAQGREMRKFNRGHRPSGLYFPLRAVQAFLASERCISNGIFFGIFALVFRGAIAVQSKRLKFDMHKLQLFCGNLNIDIPFREAQSGTFVFAYTCDDFIVARGMTGGCAVYARTSPRWRFETGINRVGGYE